MSTSVFRGSPPPAGLASVPTNASFAGPHGFDASSGLARYIEHGIGFVPAPAIQTASYTGASAGGAPGAQFGPPGVGGAPVPVFGGLSGLQLGLAALAVGGVIYLVTR